MTFPDYPVADCLDALRRALAGCPEVILEAPPGAGKTTLVPLALLDEAWLAGRRILLLEPRRIAARNAAYRMAELLDESPGGRVGYRMRLDTRVTRDTRIEVITEGILTRMLQRDPTLEGVGLVIFDEFHERGLDSDLALALCLKGRELFADDDAVSAPLKILVMSATLDRSGLARVLADAPVITSEGRMFPVDVHFGKAGNAGERITERMVKTIQRAVVDHPHSSLLAFLPGQGEIHRVEEALADWLVERRMSDVQLHPLYGNLSLEQQRRAIAPVAPDLRKLVLATNIAETSLTIEGVDVVVDSGLAREPYFNPATGMTALHTVTISRASSEQRAGRAGRLKPGHCYRLWSRAQQQQLADHAKAEILQADLAPLALQLLQWGIDDPAELNWIDPPPPGPWAQALDLLEALGATEARQGARVLTAHGEAMAGLAAHPRLAHLLLCGRYMGREREASWLAALLSERDPTGGSSPDIRYRLDLLSGSTRCPDRYRGWRKRVEQLAVQFEQQLKGHSRPLISAPGDDALPGYLLACAYPDRVARRRHSGGFQLANGRSARFAQEHALDGLGWLAVAEVSSSAGARGDLIRSAAALDEALFDDLLRDQVQEKVIVEWDRKAARFIAESRQTVGVLVLHKSRLDSIPVEQRRAALIELLQREGLRKLLNWGDEQDQWCARVGLLRALDDAAWPDTSEQGLLDSAADWLGPYLDSVSTLQDFRKLDIQAILDSMLDWSARQQLEREAPLRLQVPSGSNYRIDYAQSPPVLSVKLQEMFGCESTPTIASGRVALVVHLLSPANRPLQVTQDLGGFWRTSYHEVRKDMKGRYPKHPWPEDPLSAVPTRRVKGKQAT